MIRARTAGSGEGPCVDSMPSRRREAVERIPARTRSVPLAHGVLVCLLCVALGGCAA